MFKGLKSYFNESFESTVSMPVPIGQMDISDEKKVDVLISLMISSKTNILAWGERAFKATSWSVGIILSVVGYYILHGNMMPLKGRIIITIGIILFGILTQIYLASAKRAHTGNGYVLVKCESALRLCEKGTYFKNYEFFGYSGKYLPSKSLKVLRIFHGLVLGFCVLTVIFIDPIIKSAG